MEEVYIAMDGYIKPTMYMDVQVSRDAGCRERPWTYLRRLLEKIPNINDALEITLNSYELFIIISD